MSEQAPMSQELKYPLPWLESNFKSPDRIHELLQPELENGNLTQHDFESAKAGYSPFSSGSPFLTIIIK
jgi:hypothetical protein